MSDLSGNKLIYKNTLIIYARMLFVTFVGLFSSRFVLQALGASDFGLYNVVGGLIALFNFLGTAMSTTSRRYINVEMGKKDGNLNMVFNICLLIHVGFAVLIFLLAETIGVWYVYNVLNVTEGKLGDAMFVFQISTIVACIGIINIPYQSLIEAYQKFGVSAIIDILTNTIRLGLVIILLFYTGNALRFYALLMCGVSLVAFLLYHFVCYRRWPAVIKHKFYRKSPLYKEIIVFNNYIGLGAVSSIGRSQGSNMIVNYFFGTVVNAAFSVAYQVEYYVYLFVNKLTQASNPQVAINYSNNIDRSSEIMEKNTRLCILIMVCFFFPLFSEIDFVLGIWLKEVPEGSSLLCKLTLISALLSSFSEGTHGFIQASGKIKWFQIFGSSFMLINLPLGYCLFKMGFEAYWIVACYIVSTVIWRIISLFMMKKILGLDIVRYFRSAYFPPLFSIFIMSCVTVFYGHIIIDSIFKHIIGIFMIFFTTSICVYYIGLTVEERKSLSKFVVERIKNIR